MAHWNKITPKLKEKFCELLANEGNVVKCCAALNVSRQQMYRHRREEPDFKEQWDQAREMSIDLLEDEAFRRAFHGVTKEIYYKGEVVGTEQQYSDTLLMHRLNAERPDKYSYRQKIDANVEGNITIEVVKFADTDTE